MSESLYKISSEYQSRLNEIDENTDMEAFTEWLNEATPELHNKILAVGAYIKDLKAREKSVEDVITELCDRRNKICSRYERLEDNILNAMNLNGIKKVEGVEFDVSVRSNKSRVIIDDESKIPEQFVTYSDPIPPQKKIDKNALYDYFKKVAQSGFVLGVEGCHLEESRSLQIKS